MIDIIRFFVLALLLSSCIADGYPTVRAAALEIGACYCDHRRECGRLTTSADVCVSEFVQSACAGDCNLPPAATPDELQACLDGFEALSCAVELPPACESVL